MKFVGSPQGRTPFFFRVTKIVCIEVTGAKTPAEARQVAQTIAVHLGQSRQRAHLWTTDLSFDYVRINASYRS